MIEWVRNMGSLPYPQFKTFLFHVFRFGSPPQRDPNWTGERPNKPYRHQGPGGALPPRTFINRKAAGTGRMSAPRNYSRSGGFKEGRAGFRPLEPGGQHGGRSGETVKHESSYRSRRLEQTPVRDPSPEADAQVLGSPEKEEAASETPAPAPDTAPPPPDRPVEKKSYSRARRTRIKAGDAVKVAEEVPPPPEGLTPAPQVPETTTPPPAKTGNWEAPADSTTGGLEQDVAQLNIAEQNWNPGQPSFLQPRELRGRYLRVSNWIFFSLCIIGFGSMGLKSLRDVVSDKKQIPRYIHPRTSEQFYLLPKTNPPVCHCELVSHQS